MVLEEIGACKFKGLRHKKDGLNNAPQRHNGTKVVQELGFFLGVIFGRVRSLCLTRYLGTIFEEKTNTREENNCRVLRSKNEFCGPKTTKLRPFKRVKQRDRASS